VTSSTGCATSVNRRRWKATKRSSNSVAWTLDYCNLLLGSITDKLHALNTAAAVRFLNDVRRRCDIIAPYFCIVFLAASSHQLISGRRRNLRVFQAVLTCAAGVVRSSRRLFSNTIRMVLMMHFVGLPQHLYSRLPLARYYFCEYRLSSGIASILPPRMPHVGFPATLSDVFYAALWPVLADTHSVI
jgi:hypothetical protein